MKVEVTEHGSPKQCAFCHGAFGDGAEHSCSKCGTTYHADCAGEARTCSVFGCGQVLLARPRGVARPENGEAGVVIFASFSALVGIFLGGWLESAYVAVVGIGLALVVLSLGWLIRRLEPR